MGVKLAAATSSNFLCANADATHSEARIAWSGAHPLTAGGESDARARRYNRRHAARRTRRQGFAKVHLEIEKFVRQAI
jgi:hypothetical protein